MTPFQWKSVFSFRWPFKNMNIFPPAFRVYVLYIEYLAARGVFFFWNHFAPPSLWKSIFPQRRWEDVGMFLRVLLAELHPTSPRDLWKYPPLSYFDIDSILFRFNPVCTTCHSVFAPPKIIPKKKRDGGKKTWRAVFTNQCRPPHFLINSPKISSSYFR